VGIDIEWPWNGDVGLTASGDWALLVDTSSAAPASEQKLVRISMTGPAVYDDQGNVIVRAGDKFAQSWGVGIARYLGKEIFSQQEADITNQYLQALADDPDFITTPTPVIVVLPETTSEVLYVSVSVATVAGAVASTVASTAATSGG
jgi:hypothetical protein